MRRPLSHRARSYNTYKAQFKSKVDDNLLMVDSYLRESSSTDTQKDSWALSLPSKQQQPKNRRRRTIKSKTQTLLLLGKNVVSYGGQNSPPKQYDVVYGSYWFSFTLMCELSWNSNNDKSLSRLCFRIGSRNVWKSKDLKMVKSLQSKEFIKAKSLEILKRRIQ